MKRKFSVMLFVLSALNSIFMYFRFYGLVCMVLFSSTTFSQGKRKNTTVQTKVVERTIGADVEWSEGSLFLNDGTELKGLLKYNDNTGVVSYQNGADSKSLTSRNVAGFEFYDYTLEKQRVFYSIPYEEPSTSIVKPLFFEVIRELGTFAVLSKVDPADVKIKLGNQTGTYDPLTNPNSESIFNSSSTEIQQTETIYFMDSNGKIEPYLEIIDKEVDRVFFDKSKTKNKILDETLLGKFTGVYHDKLVGYAEENDLKFKIKSDFIKIIDYYAEIAGK